MLVMVTVVMVVLLMMVTRVMMEVLLIIVVVTRVVAEMMMMVTCCVTSYYVLNGRNFLRVLYHLSYPFCLVPSAQVEMLKGFATAGKGFVSWLGKCLSFDWRFSNIGFCF